MPITKSAKKALRQSHRRAFQNRKREDAYVRLIKQERRLVASGNTAEAERLLPSLQKAIDKAVKIGVIKPNAASRTKSRMVKLIRSASKRG